MELSIGDKVFYTGSTGHRVLATVAGLLHDGHVELEYDHGGVRVVNHGCSISFGIPIPAIDVPLTSLRKFLWTPLLM